MTEAELPNPGLASVSPSSSCPPPTSSPEPATAGLAPGCRRKLPRQGTRPEAGWVVNRGGDERVAEQMGHKGLDIRVVRLNDDGVVGKSE
jgi:hypothetical protein